MFSLLYTYLVGLSSELLYGTVLDMIISLPIVKIDIVKFCIHRNYPKMYLKNVFASALLPVLAALRSEFLPRASEAYSNQPEQYPDQGSIA